MYIAIGIGILVIAAIVGGALIWRKNGKRFEEGAVTLSDAIRKV